MEKELAKLREQASDKITSAANLSDLNEIESEFLGRKGALTSVLRSMKDLSADERKTVGQLANKIKSELSSRLESRQAELAESESAVSDTFDKTLPGAALRAGSLHPVTQLLYDLNEAFLSLGFEIYDGPDITSEAFAFDYLNFPDDHPARESMDTYWLENSESDKGAGRLCLRPHLTGESVRYMQQIEPPFRFVYPGRVFRNESTDASHERAFYQYEALVVDKEVPFTSGRLMINTILERVFGREIKTRMRSGFFPFVEPGFEIDMQCLVCEGTGCSVCGRTGWVEMMPGGPPHPSVMRAGGIDPSAWQGFYINIGFDRLVMMKYALDDIRLFHSGDLRFLKQFS